MNLKQLSHETLDQNLKNLVKKERGLLGLILLHIQEVDARKLYLIFGYQSLFAYLTEHIGYANGSAQRRIDAARLSHEVPSVIADLAKGELNLSQINLVQESLRQKEKNLETSLEPVTKEFKMELIESIKNKSMAESQVLVAKAFDLKLPTSPKVTHQKDHSVRLELTLTQEQWQKMEEMRRLLSNLLPEGSWNQVFEYLADKVIAQKTKNKGGQVAQTFPVKAHKETGGDQASKNLPPKVRRLILQRDQCCQYKSPLTGKVCGARWNLQVDHIQPRWAGGSHAAENLRVLCANHNKEIYRQQAGICRV